MTKNVGSIDRLIRAIVGIVLVLLPFVTGFGAGSAILTWGAVAVGAILAITAVTSMCPIYRVLGINTCKI